MNEPSYYRVSVKGIVVDETGRFILAREEDGMWDLIGGGLNHGEDPVAGLRREIMEETGLVATFVSSTPKYFVTSKRYKGETYVANVIYEIKLENLNFTPSQECQELRFFTIEEAKKINALPTIEEFIKVFDPKLHV